MKNLSDFVKVMDNQLNIHDCNLMIKTFETFTGFHQPIERGKPHFTQINITQCGYIEHQFQAMHDLLLVKGKEALEAYKKLLPYETSFWPTRVAFEEFRMKRYLPNDKDQFDWHIDAADELSCKRYLVFFWYLNDVIEGGETQFDDFDIVVQAKQGRLLMFPPTWQYPHKGNKPISNAKYIIGSYLHFV